MPSRLILGIATVSACIAGVLSDTPQHPLFSSVSDHGRLPRPRVAIIGGGAAGTSSAYFLHHLGVEEPHLEVDIDIFEANDYLGGRSTVIMPFEGEIDDKTDASASPYAPIELGASIFVPANENLFKAAKVFNLTLQDGHGGGSKESEEDADGMTIFNGQEFVFHESQYSWWDMTRMFWRYGWQSPLRTRDTVAETVRKFVGLYGAVAQQNGPFRTVQAFAEELGLGELAYKTTKNYLRKAGVGDLFTQELVGAATRVNYGQDPGSMQACES